MHVEASHRSGGAAALLLLLFGPRAAWYATPASLTHFPTKLLPLRCAYSLVLCLAPLLPTATHHAPSPPPCTALAHSTQIGPVLPLKPCPPATAAGSRKWVEDGTFCGWETRTNPLITTRCAGCREEVSFTPANDFQCPPCQRRRRLEQGKFTSGIALWVRVMAEKALGGLDGRARQGLKASAGVADFGMLIALRAWVTHLPSASGFGVGPITPIPGQAGGGSKRGDRFWIYDHALVGELVDCALGASASMDREASAVLLVNLSLSCVIAPVCFELSITKGQVTLRPAPARPARVQHQPPTPKQRRSLCFFIGYFPPLEISRSSLFRKFPTLNTQEHKAQLLMLFDNIILTSDGNYKWPALQGQQTSMDYDAACQAAVHCWACLLRLLSFLHDTAWDDSLADLRQQRGEEAQRLGRA